MRLVSGIARLYALLRGWRTDKKIVVFESDDWGSLRTSSKDAIRRIESLGYDVQRSCWSFDSLETTEDLEYLYQALDSVKDCRGRPACFTANVIMANPDFSAIRDSGFSKYSYVPVNESEHGSKIAEKWIEGRDRGVFAPQFHGREHVTWWEWLSVLQSGSQEAHETFDLGMCGVPRAVSKEGRSYFEGIYLESELLKRKGVDLSAMISEGLQLFKQGLGASAESVMAPVCTWSDDAERILSDGGIRFIQCGQTQLRAVHGEIKRKFHYCGEQCLSSGLYLVRNCFFEPIRSNRMDYWSKTMAEIQMAFRFGTPAIVSSHRVNFVGSIDAGYRARGLSQLRLLLAEIKGRWPDVLFLSSVDLGRLVAHGS